ncbi:histidine phosphatase family protein [Ramlibacter sp.]|uniref:histidine phosphatase family protein n=1 Tax=Ramlibacter sp. TaxID=1917967 RepID=UPI002C19CC0C|nr:histidine phosphatase family protein [Ramlibacter sp.]HWI83666.1 histidine phosphatase family protein [Ramlibacter sp.]
MELLVIRHGETEFNRAGRYLGALDPELTDRGKEQAIALRPLLADIDVVLCSPLRRARQTAELICAGRALSPVPVEWLRERHVGVFEGLTRSEAQARFPELWARNITRHWAAAPPGGESIEQVVQRVREGLAELAASCPGRRVALVCHGFVAKVLRAIGHAGFDDFFDWQLPNAGVYAMTVDGAFDTAAQCVLALALVKCKSQDPSRDSTHE